MKETLYSLKRKSHHFVKVKPEEGLKLNSVSQMPAVDMEMHMAQCQSEDNQTGKS